MPMFVHFAKTRVAQLQVSAFRHSHFPNSLHHLFIDEEAEVERRGDTGWKPCQ